MKRLNIYEEHTTFENLPKTDTQYFRLENNYWQETSVPAKKTDRLVELFDFDSNGNAISIGYGIY